MKMLLTSTGLSNENIKNMFLELTEKLPAELKVVFVPTAARTKEELFYVDESYKELLDLGILEENILKLNLDKEVKFAEVKDYDVIYVCGGNTFYLLKKVKESKFDIVIYQFLDANKLYFGVSAGSIIVCPNIDVAGPFDPNDICLKDTTGLNLIKFAISPHYTEKDKLVIDKIGKTLRVPIIRLTDNQAFLVLGNDQKVIE